MRPVRHGSEFRLWVLTLGMSLAGAAFLADENGRALADEWVPVVEPSYGQEVAPDADHDGVPDDLDNCPYAFNPDQLDRGGLGVPGSDRIGDACQCGDVTGDGIVNFVDAIIINRHEVCFGLLCDPVRVGNCDVTGDGLCNFVDAIMINREVSPGLTAPLFNADGCPNANPPTAP